jgi:hypothetical protein
MMMQFLDCLVPSINKDSNAGVQARIVAKIEEVQENQFSSPEVLENIGIKHFVLNLSSKYRFIGEDEPDKVFDGVAGVAAYPLRFFYSGPSQPSLEKFGNHIKSECNAAISSIEGNSNIVSSTSEKFTLRIQNFELSNVYRFTKALKKDYSKTEHFIEDYNFWLHRLYHTLKWVSYMKGDDDWSGAYVAIGDRLYDFLEMQPNKKSNCGII